MNLLTIFAHPIRNSYPAAVMDAFHKPFTENGFNIDLLNLYDENFDPRFTQDDHAHFWGGDLPEEIAAMHHRIEKADRLAFVYPIYWWGMPAIMKGWIERVFTGGWAYQYGKGVEDRGAKPLKSLLQNIPTILIGIGGSSDKTYEKYGYLDAMRTQIDVGTFSYCGITDVESHVITDIEGEINAWKREQGLKDVHQFAKDFISPMRVVRNRKEEHLKKAKKC
ncbi:NAD(P)H-dependent oxidoreductase [Proteus hauseri]|uniref:NAD(P)H-dependent oxidoreductase n=1 Tax=Proteus hauseri TaxID=183417 RepID=UPI0032DB5B2D